MLRCLKCRFSFLKFKRKRSARDKESLYIEGYADRVGDDWLAIDMGECIKRLLLCAGFFIPYTSLFSRQECGLEYCRTGQPLRLDKIFTLVWASNRVFF